MTHIGLERPETDALYGVLTVNEKVVTFKNGCLYGVPKGDLTNDEERDVLDYIKCLDKCKVK